MTPRDGRIGSVAVVLPSAAGSSGTRRPGRAGAPAQLVASWGRALDAFGDALDSDRRYYSPVELKELERHLAADRRWVEQGQAKGDASWLR
jgi:hypothetical protein